MKPEKLEEFKSKTMKCSVFIATSVDGMIARKDGGVEWLHTAGNAHADMGNEGDMGFNAFLNMNLTPEQWPYGTLRIIVLSSTLKRVPMNMEDKAELYSGNLNDLISRLESQGHKHAYIDGGTTIQGFLRLKLIDEMTITVAPIILGGGIPLFGSLEQEIKLTESKVKVFPNDFVQARYKVGYLKTNDK